MKIIIVRDELKKSIIKKVPIKELPEGLFEKMKDLLFSMPNVKIIYVNVDKPEDSIFDVGEKNATLACHEEERKEFLEVINLYLWYKKDHWDNNRVLNDHYKCTDCDIIIQSPISYPKDYYCPDRKCPSHENWKKIFGPSYELPKEEINIT